MPDLSQLLFGFPLWQWIVAAFAAVLISTLLYRLGFRFSKINLPFVPAVLERKPKDATSLPSGESARARTAQQAQGISQEIGTMEGGQAIGRIDHADGAQIIGTQNIFQQATALPAPSSTQGFIPPANVVKYIERGDIEGKVRDALHNDKLAAIVGVTSPGGAGKTELAIRAANELRPQFDAVFWIAMTGRDIESCVAHLARQAGVELAPQLDLRGRADAVKGRLGQMHALVVLDDVHASQTAALDLLIPPPPCATLVTSRIRDIQRIPANAMYPLDRMTPDEARELLVSILGEECIKAERAAADDLAKRVNYNPLALDISARLIKRMTQDGVTSPIAAFYSRVKDRLKEIKIGEGERESLFACIGLSYDDLTKENQKRLYCLAAFHPTGFSVNAATVIWKVAEDEAHGILEQFVNLSLLKHVNADRYRFYDLVDEFAYDKLRGSGEEHNARAALAQYISKIFSEHFADDPSTAPGVLFEFDNLRVAVAWAKASKSGELLGHLATRPRNWMVILSQWDEWQDWLESARQLGIEDPQIRANVRKAIGDVQRFRDDLDAALASYNDALSLFRAVGSRLGEANVRKAIGDVQRFRDDLDAALASYNDALSLFRAVGDRLGEANVYGSLSRLHVQKGDLSEGEKWLAKAAGLHAHISARYDVAVDYGNFAIALSNQGESAKAKEYAARAEPLFRAIGSPEADRMKRIMGEET